MKKPLLALTLSMLLSGMPLAAYAQEVVAEQSDAPVAAQQAPDAAPPVSAPTDANVSAPTEVAPATTSSSVEIAGVQDATTTQEAATSDVLESTADPQATSTTETQTTVTVDASSTDATSTPDAQQPIVVAPDQADAPQDAAPIDPQPQLDVVAQALPAAAEDASSTPAAEFSRDIDPEFMIALSGKTIPTEKKDAKTGKTLQTINAAANTSVDSSTGDLHLSGACANTYFVVLLFKNQTDYDADPRSYILNKAFPCTNGQYSYAISDLPPTLANGTYYVLVGEQGDTGSWKPITSLTEVTINRQ